MQVGYRKSMECELQAKYELQVGIIKKWFSALGFSGDYRDEFDALITAPDSFAVIEEGVENYRFSEDLADGWQNLVACLYFCEELEHRYEEKGIPREILLHTLSDLVYWTDVHVGLTGKLGVSEVCWLPNHLSMILFRLGRLQFCIGGCEKDIVDLGIVKGEPVLEVHIPAGEPLEIENCKVSFEQAKEFFAKYYPNYDYKCFTCGSWLLDDTLVNFMKETANVIRFQRLFTPVSKKESDDVIKYSFRWDTRRENLDTVEPTNSFTEKILAHAKQGGKFYYGFGYVKKMIRQ